MAAHCNLHCVMVFVVCGGDGVHIHVWGGGEWCVCVCVQCIFGNAYLCMSLCMGQTTNQEKGN